MATKQGSQQLTLKQLENLIKAPQRRLLRQRGLGKGGGYEVLCVKRLHLVHPEHYNFN